MLYALLFTAACAWTGAALFAALGQPRPTVIPTAVQSHGGKLEGIVLRREEQTKTVLTAASPVKDGERLSAGDGREESAIFSPVTDGYEYLSPAMADGLSPARLSELMASRPEKAQGTKLIYGFDFYYAAFYHGGENIEPGPCRVKFEGEAQSRRAEMISVSRDGDECAVLLRLMLDEDAISLRFVNAELIYQT